MTHDTIEGAVKWLWDLDRLAGVSSTSCVEAVLRAIEDKQVCTLLQYSDAFLVYFNTHSKQNIRGAFRNHPVPFVHHPNVL